MRLHSDNIYEDIKEESDFIKKLKSSQSMNNKSRIEDAILNSNKTGLKRESKHSFTFNE